MSGQRVDYHRYMASREWAVKREEVKKRNWGRCERCKSAPIQDVHHLTYERLGHENDDDLQGVCRPCHEYLSAKRDTDPAQIAIIRLMEDVGITAACHEGRVLTWILGEGQESFIVSLRPTPEPSKWEKAFDIVDIVVDLGNGVWAHCY